MSVPGINSVTTPLGGWGRFPVERCHLYRPERRRELAALLTSGTQRDYASRGLGRSYGDAALNRESGVISHLRLNRFLAFDPEAGVLECEAGASLADILQYFLPRGFFLPVTPGTKFVTLGGAIAADVHGKNHHRDGTVANFIKDFRLLTPSGEILFCSPASHSEIFWATFGGMGLTGVILSARLVLRRVESAYIFVDYQKTRNFEEAIEIMGESDRQYQYSVAWIDCLATGASLGRAVLMRGNHAPSGELPKRVRDPLAAPSHRQWNLPIDLPRLALNSLTVGTFNALFYAAHRNAARQLVDLEKFFYPLDAIQNWNRLYGRRGFVQYQFALPPERGRAGLAAILERLARSRRGSFLGVLKCFGDANPAPLSFPVRGYTLALDLPADTGLRPFLQELDQLVLRHGGRVYLAKDAALSAETFAAMYPQLERFRALKRRLDPNGALSSSLARRLKIAAS